MTTSQFVTRGQSSYRLKNTDKTQKPRFEVLQKISNMPRVVWAEKSKTGLKLDIGLPQQKL